MILVASCLRDFWPAVLCFQIICVSVYLSFPKESQLQYIPDFSSPVLEPSCFCFIVPVMSLDSHVTHELNLTHRATNLNPHWSILTELLKDMLSLLFACLCAKLLQLCLTLCDPRLLCPWSSPGKNTGVGCHDLLQRIFPTQGSNLLLLGLLHWQAGTICSICQIVSHVIHMFIHSIITHK